MRFVRNVSAKGYGVFGIPDKPTSADRCRPLRMVALGSLCRASLVLRDQGISDTTTSSIRGSSSSFDGRTRWTCVKVRCSWVSEDGGGNNNNNENDSFPDEV